MPKTYATSTSGGSGDVTGPASSTDNAIVRFDGTTGKIIQDYTSGAPTVSDTGVLTMQKQIILKGSTSTAPGDISIIGDTSLLYPSGFQFDSSYGTISVYTGGSRYSSFGGSGEGWKLVSGLQFSWSPNAGDVVVAASDTGLARSAAGIVKITNGSTGAGALEMQEQTAPPAPAANLVRIYAQDNGAGKTQLMALFSSGAAQQIAIQP